MKFSTPLAQCLMPLALLCCSAAIAGGSWLADGQAVQSQEVQSTNDDPAALRTDGSRKMTAPLDFDASASIPNAGIFNAFIPWSGEYSDIFVMDEDEEVMWLTSDQNVAFGVGSLFISSGRLVSFEYGSAINFEERRLDGGAWKVGAVQNAPDAIMSRGFADDRYIRSAVSNEDVSVFCYADDPQQDHKKVSFRAAAQGVGDLSLVLDPDEGVLVDDQDGRAARISSAVIRLGTVDSDVEIQGDQVFIYPDATAPDHALNQRAGDSRYLLKTTGIDATHTILAGDVLQIQNGVITAINP